MLGCKIMLMLIGFSICNCSDSSEGKFVKNSSDNKAIYFNDRFGWEFEIPTNWVTLTKIEKMIWKNHGNNLAEKEFGENSTDTWKEILNIKKGIKINQLVATCSNYNPEIHGDDYELSKEKRFIGSKQILEKNPGVEVEAIRTNTEIDGVKFDTYNMSIKKNGEQKGYQIMLEKKYENNEILLIGIVVSEKEKLEELKNVLMASKFKRKN